MFAQGIWSSLQLTGIGIDGHQPHDTGDSYSYTPPDRSVHGGNLYAQLFLNYRAMQANPEK